MKVLLAAFLISTVSAGKSSYYNSDTKHLVILLFSAPTTEIPTTEIPTTEIPTTEPGACPTNMKSRYQFVSDMQMAIIPTNNGYTGMYMDVNFTVGFCPYVVEVGLHRRDQ